MATIDQSIATALESLVGLPAWGLQRTVGSMFFLELGGAVSCGEIPGKHRLHGEWHFLFELCSWQFEESGVVLVSDNDLPEVIDSTFASLHLGNVKAANLELDPGQLTIDFAEGITLVVSSDDAYGQESAYTEWLFFLPGELAWRRTKHGLSSGNIHTPRGDN